VAVSCDAATESGDCSAIHVRRAERKLGENKEQTIRNEVRNEFWDSHEYETT
jgi:hypothetical protein